MSFVMNYAARSDVGLVRSSNQDSGYAGPHLLILADGMGGPAGGDIASSVAVAHLVDLDDDTHPVDDLLPLLRDALDSAHEELMNRSVADPELAGLGTTCIAILRSGNKIGMVHIGDSRAYLLRGGILTQVTTDHTYVQHLVDEGKITPEQAAVHPHRNMILKALGDADGEVVPDESIREAQPGDRWLLCSDGLSGLVSHETIEETLIGITNPGECADALIDLALRAGGTDNVTVVVADMIPTESMDSDWSPSTVPQIVGAAATDRLATSRAAGNTPAGRAAALTPPATPPDDDQDPQPRRRFKGLGLALGLLLLIGLVVGGGYAGYSWSQTRFYVAESNGYVAIFRGIPQEIGPISLSSEYRVTDIAVADLTQVFQERLAETITRPSLAEAEAYIEDVLRPGIAKDPADDPTVTPTDPVTAEPSDAEGGSPLPVDGPSDGVPLPSPIPNPSDD